MGVMTISISDDAEDNLRELAKKNIRSISKQVEYLITKEVKEDAKD